MTTLFISDLHLEDSRPDITDALLHLLAGEARSADALYVLGDLFEAWVGDDDDSTLADTVALALREVADVLDSRRALAERLLAARTAARSATEAARLARLRHGQGIANLLQVLSAEDAALANQRAHVGGHIGIAVGDRLALADDAAQLAHQRACLRFGAGIGQLGIAEIRRSRSRRQCEGQDQAHRAAVTSRTICST